MNITRNGKIARLPGAIREELNHRLDDGTAGKNLVEWLNTLPTVRAILASEWNGRPIRAQNLSEWKKGGYRDWQIRSETQEAAVRLTGEFAEWNPGEPQDPSSSSSIADSGASSVDSHPSVTDMRVPSTDTLALWLAARYAVVVHHLLETGDLAARPLLREFCHDLVQLRREDHRAERLRLAQARLEFDRTRHRETVGKEPSQTLGEGADTSVTEQTGNGRATADLRPHPAKSDPGREFIGPQSTNEAPDDDTEALPAEEDPPRKSARGPGAGRRSWSDDGEDDEGRSGDEQKDELRRTPRPISDDAEISPQADVEHPSAPVKNSRLTTPRELPGEERAVFAGVVGLVQEAGLHFELGVGCGAILCHGTARDTPIRAVSTV